MMLKQNIMININPPPSNTTTTTGNTATTTTTTADHHACTAIVLSPPQWPCNVWWRMFAYFIDTVGCTGFNVLLCGVMCVLQKFSLTCGLKTPKKLPTHCF